MRQPATKRALIMLKDSFDEPEMMQMTPAQPLHIQRLEASLNMDYFMSSTQNLLLQPLTDNEESSDTESGCDQAVKLDRHIDKSFMCNQRDSASSERDWLREIVLDSEESGDSGGEISDEDEYVKQMLSEHVRERKYRSQYYQNKRNAQYAYYGTGLISLHDAHADHQRSVVGNKRPRKMPKKPVPPKQRKLTKQQQRQLLKQQRQEARLALAAHNRSGAQLVAATGSGHTVAAGSAMFAGSAADASGFDAELTDAELSAEMAAGGMFGNWKRGGAGRKKSGLPKTPEAMAALRKRVWQLMAKKELGKVQRLKSNNHKEALINYKRMATVCLKIGRQRAMQSQKTMRETVWRAKRLTREMQGYWKKFDRVERDTRRRMEKEAEEQRKHDVELNEAKRQQRKLNFLITQTELYAHFMSRKLGTGSEAEQLKILSQLDEETAASAAAAASAAVADDYDCDEVKQAALKNASDAFVAERNRTQQFHVPKSETAASPAAAITNVKLEATGSPKIEATADEDDGDLPQPSIFCGSLKGYQIKGMTWLAGLYDKGISGILADEMGLGKTVQSIAFLCHIAESSNVWGPFLVISPASTLHNWQQELQRFVPAFKVVPYWGAPQERKVLRQFWDTRNLHTREASFHVVVTSYQLIVSDYKYFNRIKWQCMILDEAQAIKSAASVRWKLLLAFNCRNRLLLSGTPIQNSMAELWALLHFIMPTLFDSHDEFNEWFSKDIESHAENKTGIDEQQISRLHMILKPFMLRRIKKDVENELSDKIEVMVYCPLTTRQRKLYASLKRQIRIEDLLQYAGGGGGSAGSTSSAAAADPAEGGLGDRSVTSNLMNLVMQFRKVCNHPELFERRDARSPFYMQPAEFEMPRLLADADGVWDAGRLKLLNNTLNIFRAEHIHRSIFPSNAQTRPRCTFSFARFCQLETVDMERIVHGGLIYLLQSYLGAQLQHNANVSRLRHSTVKPARIHLLQPSYELDLQQRTSLPLRFTTTTRCSQSVYTFAPIEVHAMPETIEHRLIRSRNRLRQSATNAAALQRPETETPAKSGKTSPPTLDDMLAAGTLVDEHEHRSAEVRRMPCEPVSMPTFLFEVNGRISCGGRRLHVCSRRAQWRRIRHEQLESAEGRQLVERALDECYPRMGWSNIIVPDKQTLVSDAGKLQVLDSLLTRLKAQKHRVLIYSQMTKVIDLLEEYMRHKKHSYMRLDGSSKISARRDMVADFQNRTDIFVFLLSTRAGGLGINLTAADTVIFYDSDWNPTVDQQAMDRAHRLGQTKQVTVYRLICKGTIEERILQRARKKSEIQRMVISGGNFKPDTLKPKEVVSLLLDDEEIDIKLCQRTDEDELIEVDEKIEIDLPSASVEPTATISPTTLPVDSDIKRIIP